ncbi:uncharacterized protein [Epargyreus clarus]|uniref:uncharacterized protein n=1 Tax=Epargyreus clarus TaxID=520877 RepID=UPI003C2F0D2C
MEESRRGRHHTPTRPITLGEILLREEQLDDMPPPSRPMGRVMSETRRLGALANGRPRRPRGRTLTRPSTSSGQAEEEEETVDPPPRRRRSASLSLPALARWRNATAESRVESFYGIVSAPSYPWPGRQGTSRTTRPRNHSVARRSGSPDLFYNPFSWQRRHSAGRHTQSRSRSNTNSIPRSGPLLHGRPQRMQRSIITVPLQSSSTTSRMIDVYDSRSIYTRRSRTNSSSSRYLRSNGRPRTAIARNSDPDARRNTSNGRARPEMPQSVQRFVDFATEFIPVTPPAPDAEPPEWSLNTTPADFGPFAIGRSAISRARSLAMIAALSQVDEEEANPTNHLNQ